MAQPTQLTISYGTSSQATLAIPIVSAGSVAGASQPSVPQDYTLSVRSIFLNGGFWVGTSFVPWSQITSIIAS
jgi:hypothetical protein